MNMPRRFPMQECTIQYCYYKRFYVLRTIESIQLLSIQFTFELSIHWHLFWILIRSTTTTTTTTSSGTINLHTLVRCAIPSISILYMSAFRWTCWYNVTHIRISGRLYVCALCSVYMQYIRMSRPSIYKIHRKSNQCGLT